MRTILITAAAVLAAGPAAADWVHRAPQASDDLGSAYVENGQGQRLDVGCGNSGMIALRLSPNPGVQTLPGEVAMMVFSVDSIAAARVPTRCDTHGCDSGMMADGSPWPVSQMQALTRALRSGSDLQITLGPTGLAQFTLAGSSAALQRLASTTRCEGF